MKRIFTLVLVTMACLPAEAQNKVLTVLGSSTAQGVGASVPDSSWVRRLNYHYKYELAVLDTVHNRAKSGKDPYFSMPSSYVPPINRPFPNPDSNITRVLQFNPDVVIVSFVSNNFDIYTFEEIRNTLTTIRDSANEAGKICFITTPQPRTSFGTTARVKLRDLKDSVIKWFGPYSINFFDPLVDPTDLSIRAEYRYSRDQVHINDAGHRVLYEQVLAKEIFSAALSLEDVRYRQRRPAPSVKLLGNPVINTLNIEITVKEEGMAYLEIADAGGRNVHSSHQPLYRNTNRIGISVSNLASGVYFLKLGRKGEESRTIRFQVRK